MTKKLCFCCGEEKSFLVAPSFLFLFWILTTFETKKCLFKSDKTGEKDSETEEEEKDKLTSSSSSCELAVAAAAVSGFCVASESIVAFNRILSPAASKFDDCKI